MDADVHVCHRFQGMPSFACRYKVCLDSDAYDFRGRGAANPQFWSSQVLKGTIGIHGLAVEDVGEICPLVGMVV